jgi:hypothetical protein
VATILIDGKEPLKHDFKLSQDGKLELDLASVKEAKLTGKLACTMDEEENDNTVACKEMKLEVKDGKVSASAIYELTDHKVKPDAKPVWSPETATFDDKTASFELPKDAESFTASLSLELDGGKNLACSGEWKKDPNSDSGKDKPKIEATKESETPANIVAKAKITVLKDKKPEVVDKVDGYTIVWYRKGAANFDLPKVDLTPKKDEKKDGGLKGVAKDGGEAATEPAVDPAKVKPLPEKEDPNKVKIAEGTPTVTAPRSAKGDYEVCAELQGKGEVISGGCVKVPKIATPMMRNGGQQYMPNRNQTAAPGMR